MEDFYVCSRCGNSTDDEVEFQTSLDNDTAPDDLICEYCYDDMNEE